MQRNSKLSSDRRSGELGATLNTALVVMGDQLGLYRAMSETGPTTPTELASRPAPVSDTSGNG